MTAVFRGLAFIVTAVALWFLSLVLLGLIARVVYLGLLTGWNLI